MGGWVAPSLFAMPRAIEFQVRTASKTANDSFLRLFPPPSSSLLTNLFFSHIHLRTLLLRRKKKGRKRERERDAHSRILLLCLLPLPLCFFSNFFLMAMTRTHVSKHFSPVSNAGEKHVGQPIVLSVQIDVLCGVMGSGAALCLMHFGQRNFRGLATWGSLSPPLFFAACILLPLPRALHAPSETTTTRD